MKKNYILTLLCLLLTISCVHSQSDKKQIHELVTDLSTANVKLRGKLLLFGKYEGNLSTLSFQKYLKLLKENESESNKGLSDIIMRADKHLFKANKNTFIIAFYSNELNVMICDDANTSIADSVVVLNKQVLPNLNEFFKKTIVE